ncbi:MAG: DUF2891 family protein [Phenylobacterium sp.]|nr:DUF2891 family protein [Phenylobacterium sp.]
MKLQAELLAHDAPWAATHQPLAEAFAQRFRDFLPLAAYPIRTGVHSSTAFALTLAADYADIASDAGLLALFQDRVAAWYGEDHGAQAWEPSLDDFLSPTLMEAACMARLTSNEAFQVWFDAFLPEVAGRRPATLFQPVTPTDRTDGKIAHLDGLNLSRAWCWRRIAAALPADHPAQAIIEDTAQAHLAAALPHVAGDYMAEHWLASFALLALTA